MKKIIFILITGLIVWITIQFPKTMVNPGDLTTGHQNLSDNCYSCHKPFWGISNENCIKCHTLSEIGKDTVSKKDKILFHETLSNQSCGECHTDHIGKNPDIKFTGFKHDLLPEKNLSDCNSCHKKPEDKLHSSISPSCNNCHITNSWKQNVKFNHEMIQGADKNNCASCHQKPGDEFHQGLADNCSKCHSSDKWTPANFNHSSYFLLDKDHNSKCITCHTTKNYKDYTCYGCHEHTQINILKEHDEVSGDLNDCVSCHKSGNKHDMKNKDGNEKFESDSREKSNDKKSKHDDEDDD